MESLVLQDLQVRADLQDFKDRLAPLVKTDRRGRLDLQGRMVSPVQLVHPELMELQVLPVPQVLMVKTDRLDLLAPLVKMETSDLRVPPEMTANQSLDRLVSRDPQEQRVLPEMMVPQVLPALKDRQVFREIRSQVRQDLLVTQVRQDLLDPQASKDQQVSLEHLLLDLLDLPDRMGSRVQQVQ
jgi:hypothetical protein